MAGYTIPRPNSPPLDQSGRFTTEWFNYLRSIAATGDSALLQAEIAALALRVTALENAASTDAIIQGINSVLVTGSIHNGLVQVSLVGDSTPDPSSYYGSDATGSLGYWPIPATGVLPVVTGEIDGGQPVFVYADDGSLIYSGID